MKENEQRLSSAEAVALVRFAKGCFPAMQVDEFTPDSWGVVLGPLLFEDCKLALVNLARRLPFAAASDIYGEVRRIRRERIGAFGLLPEPPSGLGQREYQEWQWKTTRAIADGELTPPDRRLELVQKYPPVEYNDLLPRIPGE